MTEIPSALAWIAAPARVHQALCVAAGLAVLQQSVELLSLSSSLSARGLWPWAILRTRYRGLPWPLLALLDRLLDERGTRALLVASSVAAVSMLVTPSPTALCVCLLVMFLMAIRFWGSVNGGSDSMTLLVLLSATVSEAAGPGTTIGMAALWYLGLQSLVSYMLAGLVKVQSASWRQGKALAHHLRGAGPGPPPGFIAGFISSRGGGIVTAWCVILFELLAPFSLLDVRLTAVFIALAFTFHAVNAWLLGLHRFTLPWLASHVALLALAAELSRELSL